MYSNVKQRAKEKDGDKKKTGGGQTLKWPNARTWFWKVLKTNHSWEASLVDWILQALLDDNKIKKQFISIVTECSKAVTASSTDTAQYLAEPTASSTSRTEKDYANGSACSRKSCMAENESYPFITGKGKRRKVVVDELYELEKKRAEAEIALLEQQKEQGAALFEIKRDMLQASMEQEKILFELKGNVLQENLNKALEQNLLLWNEN